MSQPVDVVVPTPPEPVIEMEDITITAVGDMTLGHDISFSVHNRFDTVIDAQDDKYNYSLSNVKHIFEQDDLTIVNLETTLTDSMDRNQYKTFTFKGDPEYVKMLSQNSVEVATLANNHTHDYGQKGFDDTVMHLKDVGVIPIGMNSPEFGEGLTFDYSEITEVKGVKIGLLAYKGWIMQQTNLDKISSDIKKMREKGADIITVSYHWGDEGVHIANDVQKNLARFTIDSGADMIIGHHPHVLQGIEKYKDRYIVYSLGNFVFGGNSNPRVKDTIIYQNEFRVNLTEKKIESVTETIIPTRISSVNDRNDYRPIIVEGEAKVRIEEDIKRYSLGLN